MLIVRNLRNIGCKSCLIVAKGGDGGDGPVGGIRIVQVNLHHCRDANDAVSDYAIANNINIILCQDPYVLDGVASGIPTDWPVYFSGLLNSAIIITNKDYAVISSLVLDNTIVISLNVLDKVVYIGSQYSPPSGNLDKDFNDLSNHFESFDNMLLAGDFNVPLLELGYSRQSERTEILLEHLMDKNLVIVNDIDAPYSFVQGSLHGRPDLTLAGLEVCSDIQDWMVDDKNFSFSDHRYIVYSLGYTPVGKANTRFKTKNKSFKKFNAYIKDSENGWLKGLIEVKNTEELDVHVKDFISDVTRIAEKCFRKGVLSHKSTIRWFTQDLKTQRNKVSAMYKRYVKNPDDNDMRESYKNARRAYNKNVRRAKKTSWENFCNKTNDSFGTLYKFVSGKATRHTDYIFTKLNDSECFDSYDEVARSLMVEHFGIDNVPANIHDFTSQVFNNVDCKDVTNRELNYVISKQDNNKAPGYDALDAAIVKNICRKSKNYVKRLLSVCLKFGHFPELWKNGVVIFFRKRNKDGRSARSYRPITLLCIFGKLLERIIKIRVMPKLESLNFLDDAQFGFREKRSTISALEHLRNLVKNNLKDYKYYAMTSIDIQAAFDAVVWEILANLIDSLPIAAYLKRILKNYISKRKIGFKFTYGIIWFVLYRGCPQGSCLGPLLWLIVADFLIKKYRTKYQEIISYADDFTIFAGADTRRELEIQMNARIAWFKEICDELSLKISGEKCVSMLFGRFLLEDRRPIFKIDRNSIPVKDTIDYLGVTIDSKFNWIAHIEKVREKVRSLTSNIKKTAVRDRGLQATYRKIWYCAVIEKQISYGYEVWLQDLNIHGESKLSSSQRLGLLSIISAYRTVSTAALCVLAGVAPIYIKLKHGMIKHKVLNGEMSIYDGDIEIKRDNIMHDLGTCDYPDYTSLKNLIITDKSDHYFINEKHPFIYTDGSKMVEGVGAAFTVLYNNNFIFDFKISLNGRNSIYQAELTAIRYAIDWFMSSHFTMAYLFTDNKASTLVLQRNFPINDIVKNIYDNFNSHPEKELTLGWTRAHIGNPGNERADELAKAAIDPAVADVVEEVKFPISWVKRICLENIRSDWQEDWRHNVKGSDTYKVFKKVDDSFICVSQVIQYFVSAHGSFPEYLFKIGKRSNALCDCGSVGNVHHYLFGRCPVVPFFFHFDNSQSISYNFRRVLFDKKNYSKLCAIYNALNAKYSFIRYRF